MNIVSLKGEKRTEFGTKASRDIRKAGMVPCVVYGTDILEHFQLAPNALKPLIYTAEFKLAEVDLNGTVVKCIVKDFDFHPVTDEILHVDFLALKDDVIVKTDIPVAFKGVSEGEKLGGKRIQLLRKVSVKTLPTNLVNELYVSMLGVNLGGSVRIKDIEKPEGMEILQEPNIPVASVEVPRALKSAEAAEEKAAGEEGEEGVVAEEGAKEE